MMRCPVCSEWTRHEYSIGWRDMCPDCLAWQGYGIANGWDRDA